MVGTKQIVFLLYACWVGQENLQKRWIQEQNYPAG